MSGRAPTVYDVARAAGVTHMTVSRVLRGTRGASDTTRDRVLEAVRLLGYTPNAVAQGLRTRRTRTVALLIGNVASPFFALVARGFEAAVRAHGYVALICSTDQSPAQEAHYVQTLLQRRVDGVAVAPVESDPAAFQPFVAQGTPLVLVDRTLPTMAVDSVAAHDREGAAAATRHLIAVHGHRRIAGLFGPADVSTARERRAGYESALAELGLPIEPTLVGHCAYTLDEGRALALRLLRRRPRPTAVLAAGNFITAGVLEAAQELGLAVPDDVALIGFGPSPRSVLERPDLSIVGMDAEAMGRRAGAMLMHRLEHDGDAPPLHERFPATLLLSTSCGCPREAAR